MTKLQLWQQHRALSPLQRTVLLVLGAVGVSLIYGVGLALPISPLMLLAAPLALGVIWLALFKPEYAAVVMLGLLWGLLVDVAVQYMGVPAVSKYVLVVLLTGVLVLRRFTGQRYPWLYDSTIWWLGAYFLLVCLGVWYARYPDRVIDLVIETSKNVLNYFVLINLLNRPKVFRAGIWALLAVGALLGTVTVYQEITQTYRSNYGGLAQMKIAFIAEGVEERPRASGPTGDPNPFGQQLLVLVPLGVWGLLYSKKTWQRLAAGYATMACLAGVGLSFSRSSLLALSFALALYAVHIRFNWRYLLWLVPLLGALLYVAPPEFTARITSLTNLFSDEGVRSEGAFKGRSSEALMGVYMFADHPFLGVGGNNSPAYYPQYIRDRGSPVPDEERATHNMYVEIAAEHGVLGIVIMGGIMLLTLSRLRSAQHWFRAAGEQRMTELAVALQISFAGYLVSAIFLHGVYPRWLWIQVALAVALAAIAKRAANPSPAEQDLVRLAASAPRPRAQGMAQPALQPVSPAPQTVQSLSSSHTSVVQTMNTIAPPPAPPALLPEQPVKSAQSSVSKQAVQGTLWAYLSFVMVKSLTLVSTIIITNLLLPAEYGVMGYCLLALQYLDILMNFGMDNALVSRQSKIEEASNAAFIISIITGVTLFALAWVASPTLAVFFNEPQITPLFRTLAFVLPIGGLGMVPSAMLKRSLRFKQKMLPDVISTLIKGLLSVSLAWLGFSVWSLVYAQIAAVISAVSILWLLARWRPTFVFERQVTREMLNFGIHIVAVGLLGALLSNVDYLLVGKLLGAAALGYYTIAYRIPELVIRNTNDVIAKVAHPLLSQLQSDREQLRSIYFSYVRYISLFTFPAGVGLALITPSFLHVFIPKWTPAIASMQLVSLALAISSIGYIPGVLYKAINRPKLLNQLAWIKAPIAILLLWLGTRWDFVGVAAAQLAVAIINVTLDSFVVSRVVKLNISEMISSLVPAIIGSAVMALAVGIVAVLFQLSNPVAFGLYLVVGGLAYIGALLLVSRNDVLRARRALRTAFAR